MLIQRRNNVYAHDDLIIWKRFIINREVNFSFSVLAEQAV